MYNINYNLYTPPHASLLLIHISFSASRQQNDQLHGPVGGGCHPAHRSRFWGSRRVGEWILVPGVVRNMILGTWRPSSDICSYSTAEATVGILRNACDPEAKSGEFFGPLGKGAWDI